MKSTFWMTAQETEDELKHRKILAPICRVCAPLPSTKLWSECPRCDNGIYNGRECAICWGTGRVTESLLQQEAAVQPQIDDISIICAEIACTDEFHEE